MRMWNRDNFWPAVLVLVGVYFLLLNLGVKWLSPQYVWPAALIAIGLWLIVRRARV